jgi:hypothetical protein
VTGSLQRPLAHPPLGHHRATFDCTTLGWQPFYHRNLAYTCGQFHGSAAVQQCSAGKGRVFKAGKLEWRRSRGAAHRRPWRQGKDTTAGAPHAVLCWCTAPLTVPYGIFTGKSSAAGHRALPPLDKIQIVLGAGGAAPSRGGGEEGRRRRGGNSIAGPGASRLSRLSNCRGWDPRHGNVRQFIGYSPDLWLPHPGSQG